MSTGGYLWFNGSIVADSEATIHPLSTALKYGAGVFEGLRAYVSSDGETVSIFRLHEHCRRLVESAKTLRFDTTMSADDYAEATLSLVQANRVREDSHIRIQVIVDKVGGFIDATGPVTTYISAVAMGRYDQGAGKHVSVSSWARIADNSMPPRVKSIANYENSRLALLQAKMDGYDDTIMLTSTGKVAEGPGYNVFMVRNGELVTPPVTAGILEGVTRSSLIAIARSLGVAVVERDVDRTELYAADEIFFCGSAAEVTPVVSVDRHVVGTGQPGRFTTELSAQYLRAARDGLPNIGKEWRTVVTDVPSQSQSLTSA